MDLGPTLGGTVTAREGAVAYTIGRRFTALTATTLFAIALLPYATGLAYYVYLRAARPTFAAAPDNLGGMVICCVTPPAAAYLKSIEALRNDLVDLGMAHSTIFSLDFANPIPFLLRAPPPRAVYVPKT